MLVAGDLFWLVLVAWLLEWTETKGRTFRIFLSIHRWNIDPCIFVLSTTWWHFIVLPLNPINVNRLRVFNGWCQKPNVLLLQKVLVWFVSFRPVGQCFVHAHYIWVENVKAVTNCNLFLVVDEDQRKPVLQSTAACPS